MKYFVLILIALNFAACGSKDRATTDEAAKPANFEENENEKIMGSWIYSTERIDSRIGKITTEMIFYFKANNELEINKFITYAMAPTANAKRIEKGTYLFNKGVLSIAISDSTCPSELPEAMTYVAGNANELEFHWDSEDGGYYALNLNLLAIASRISNDGYREDISCQRF